TPLAPSQALPEQPRCSCVPSRATIHTGHAGRRVDLCQLCYSPSQRNLILRPSSSCSVFVCLRVALAIPDTLRLASRIGCGRRARGGGVVMGPRLGCHDGRDSGELLAAVAALT